LNKPHVVLGTRPGEENKWTESDLAKCIITEESLLASTEPAHITVPMTGETATVELPSVLAYGVGAEKEALFGTLPALAADASANATADREVLLPDQLEAVHASARARELRKAEALARVVDLRNANASGIAYENRRRIVEAFSESGKPNDTGRTEVQGMRLLVFSRNFGANFSLLFVSCYHDDADPELVVSPCSEQAGSL
jgi:small subunit ribosomal protein S15